MAKTKRSSGVLNFKFRQSDSIGAVSAELDDKFLCDCFVDTGVLDSILDADSSSCIIVGRTGAGKSALLKLIQSRDSDNVICINPEDIAIRFLSTTTVIQWLISKSLKLNPVFKLLWRHIIAVELFHHINSEKDQGWTGFRDWIRKMIGMDSKRTRLLRQAENYVNQYGDAFWDTTETRVKSIVDTFSNKVREEVKAKVGIDLCSLTGGEEFDEAKTKTITQEIITNFSSIVNQDQIGDLKTLETIFEGMLHNNLKNKTLYIMIDDLDRDWVDEPIKYSLLRTLIDTAQELNRKLKGIKIILGLRLDLIGRVFKETQESGQQIEKYEDIIYSLRWSIEELTTLANKRINKLVSDRYTGTLIELGDILPETTLSGKIHKQNKAKPLQYLWDQTWFRPRDVITFVNYCLEVSSGHSKLTKEIVKQAEKKYSSTRFRSLIDEWHQSYPEIETLLTFLKNRKQEFEITDIPLREIENLALNMVDVPTSELVRVSADELISVEQSLEDQPDENLSPFAKQVFSILYEVGAIGIKTGPQKTTFWKHVDEHGLASEDIQKSSKVSIHQALWHELNVSRNFDRENQ